VRFNELSTEGCCDFVKLYDGTSSSAPLLGSFAGTAVPAAVASTGGALTVVFTSDSSSVRMGFVANLTSASTVAASKLIGTVPATLGDLRCIGSITRMCARSCHSAVSDPISLRLCCSDLSEQNLTGQLPDAITRLRLLSSMCARIESY
jgi:chromosome condensin MukBEF MukE localization factor